MASFIIENCSAGHCFLDIDTASAVKFLWFNFRAMLYIIRVIFLMPLLEADSVFLSLVLHATLRRVNTGYSK